MEPVVEHRFKICVMSQNREMWLILTNDAANYRTSIWPIIEIMSWSDIGVEMGGRVSCLVKTAEL